MSEQQTIEREFSEPVVFGENNIANNSIFNEGVSIGGRSLIQNCRINGTLRIDGNECIITGCYVHSTNEHDIYITPNNQNHLRLTGEGWPRDAITEINEGRATLQSRGFIGTEPTLSAPTSVLECLDEVLPNTSVTYRQFLLQNGLISGIHASNDQEGIALTVPLEGYAFTGNNRGIKSKFSDEVTEKAWKLLEEYMTPTQHFAFMEGSKIELENKTEDFRLLINKNGDFSILEGKRGEGIMATSGRIKSYDYPLGDEIATFLDWFKFKTKELISQWNCGTYGIVKEGKRR